MCSSPASAWWRRRRGARALLAGDATTGPQRRRVRQLRSRASTPGTVVHVVSDRIAELGAEDGDGFSRSRSSVCSNPVMRHSPRRAAERPPSPRIAALNRLADRDRHHGQHRSRRRTVDCRGRRAVQAAGRDHGRGGVHVCVPDPRRPFRPGARGVERRGAARIAARWKISEAIDAWAPRCSRSSTPHEALARRLALSERLLHLRRDRQPADRSRGTRVLAAPRRRRGLEPGGVRRRADITKLSYHAYAYCADRYVVARRRQRARQELRTAADLEARDLDRSRWPPADVEDRDSRAGTRPRTSCSASRFPARRTRPSWCSRRSRRRCWTAKSMPG